MVIFYIPKKKHLTFSSINYLTFLLFKQESETCSNTDGERVGQPYVNGSRTLSKELSHGSSTSKIRFL